MGETDSDSYVRLAAGTVIRGGSEVKANLARQMRRKPTPAENVLWQQLRANRAAGVPFRRQVILGGFIVDFYCHRFQLAIEVDGDIHDLQAEYDAERTQILNGMGIRMIRFHNDAVLSNVFAVVRSILDECAKQQPNGAK